MNANEVVPYQIEWSSGWVLSPAQKEVIPIQHLSLLLLHWLVFRWYYSFVTSKKKRKNINQVEEGKIKGIINEADVSSDSPTSDQMMHLSVSLPKNAEPQFFQKLTFHSSCGSLFTQHFKTFTSLRCVSLLLSTVIYNIQIEIEVALTSLKLISFALFELHPFFFLHSSASVYDTSILASFFAGLVCVIKFLQKDIYMFSHAKNMPISHNNETFLEGKHESFKQSKALFKTINAFNSRTVYYA